MNVVRATADGTHIVRYDRVRRGEFFADLIRDKRLRPEVYHCVVQRDGSTEILVWTQSRSLESALEAAEAHLQRLTTNTEAPASKV